jgi:hypothetical protein
MDIPTRMAEVRIDLEERFDVPRIALANRPNSSRARNRIFPGRPGCAS